MKDKTLAIITDCVHTLDETGNYATSNHIFLAQMEAIAAHFKNTVICCPFVNYSGEVISIYTNVSIEFIQLKMVGGNQLKDKIKLLMQIPVWIKCFNKLKNADFVYQRFPANLNIPGFFYFKIKKFNCFASYTGTWKNYKKEPFTYRFQKWLLKNYFNGPVFIYASRQKKANLIPTFSPSYHQNVWNKMESHVEDKIKNCSSILKTPVFVTVGNFNSLKNQQYILETFKNLHQKKFSFKLIMVGDGILKKSYQSFIIENRLEDCIFITGNKTAEALQDIYCNSDFIVQASLVEGFGKVPVEGFYFGLIPILNDVGLSAEITGFGDRGFLFDARKKEGLEILIEKLKEKKDRFPSMILNGRKYAKNITLQNWADAMTKELKSFYGA